MSRAKAADEPMTAAGETFAVMAGGGSGGHVLPALAVAEALVAAGHPHSSIHFVGSSRGMEATLVPAAGFPSTLFRLTSFPRKLTIRHGFAALELAKAVIAAVRLIGRLAPRVVVSVGGYASVPAVLAARLGRIPIVVMSFDAKPGRANAFAARFAAASAVAFDDTDMPNKVVTGPALRAAMTSLDRAASRPAARARLGLPEDRFVLAVVGGSQGSGALNAVVDAFVLAHRGRRDLAIRHVVGARHDDNSRRPLDGSDGLLYQVVGFEERMEDIYASADVLLARSGASVLELAAVGMPAILVPWPDAAEDHQTANARWLSDQGAAVLVPETELDPERLDAELTRLAKPGVLDRLGAAAHTLGRRDGASRIARVVEDCARR